MVNIKVLEPLQLGGPKRNVFESDHELSPSLQNTANDLIGNQFTSADY
jgi:hypothetical protein